MRSKLTVSDHDQSTVSLAETKQLCHVARTYLIGKEWYWNWLDLLVVIPAWSHGRSGTLTKSDEMTVKAVQILVCSQAVDFGLLFGHMVSHSDADFGNSWRAGLN